MEVLPSTHREALSNSPTISIKDFIGHERVAISGNAHDVETALQNSDAGALYKVERLWAPFYCRVCARLLCGPLESHTCI